MHSEDRPLSSLQRVASGAAIAAAAIAVLALLGWVTGFHTLVELVPDAPRMAAGTAAAVIMLAASLWLVRDGDCSVEARAWSRLLAELAVLIGVLTMIEYAFGVDLGIDHAFDDDPGARHPGRMSPHAAAALISCGLWLALLDHRRGRWGALVDGLSALSGLIVLAAVIGWLYGADFVYGDTGDSGVAPQTALALLALLVGVLAARPGTPAMRLLLSRGAGGHAMRRLIPALIALPILGGYLLVLGVEQDLISTPVAAAVEVAALIAILLAVLVYTSRELEHADHQRNRLQRRLIELADRDPLTKIFNRRRLDEELRRQFALAQRAGSRVAVLAVDLDDFKRINESYGHATGDELLLATAEVLGEELRASDFVCRTGGDDFTVLLPNASDESARIVAGKLVRALRGIKRPRPGGGAIELRASLGLALSDAGGWMEPRDVLKAADRALHAAQEAGGDRFAVDEALALDSASPRT